MSQTSANNMPEVGPLGRNLIENVRRLLADRGLSYNRLSVALEAAGRAIPPLGISRMMKGERRIDVDELTTLAQVLDVSPAELLAPPSAGKPGKDHAAFRAAQDLATRVEQLLAASGDPETSKVLSGYLGRALRRVQIEVEELLEENARTARGRTS